MGKKNHEEVTDTSSTDEQIFKAIVQPSASIAEVASAFDVTPEYVNEVIERQNAKRNGVR